MTRISHLTRRVETGAYAGLYTTSGKRGFLVSIDRDLAEVSGPRCRILFYDNFPAGYLLGHGRADTNAAWLLNVGGTRRPEYQRLLLGYYAKHDAFPDVVVRINRFPGPDTAAPTYQASDPLERLFGGRRYAVVDQRRDYRISVRAGATCK